MEDIVKQPFLPHLVSLKYLWVKLVLMFFIKKSYSFSYVCVLG